MKTQHISIFNLIEIFKSSKSKILQTINPQTHCAEKHLHDYYCDAEKPFVANYK